MSKRNEMKRNIIIGERIKDDQELKEMELAGSGLGSAVIQVRREEGAVMKSAIAEILADCS